MRISHLKTNHLDRPLGFLMDGITLSFRIEEAAASKKDVCRVLVSKDPEFSCSVFDSGLSGEIDESGYLLPFEPSPCTRYYWKVYVKAGTEEAWSGVSWFETSKATGAPWKADFITQTFSQDENPIFVKEFDVGNAIPDNRLYILALGVYEVFLNGEKVGRECLLPGIHAYDHYLQYQTYELPLRKGRNRLEVRVGKGWYKGEFGLSRPYPLDNEHALIAELHLCRDGHETIIGSDLSWTAMKNPITTDGIYLGEVFDPQSLSETVYPVRKAKHSSQMKNRLIPRLSPPLEVMEKLKPELLVTPKGDYVLDLHQNMTGWLSFVCHEPAGKTLRFQFGEILQDGEFYNGNLRTAKAEYVYVSDGIERTVCQHYTFYGFRYVRLSGFDEKPDAKDFCGLAIRSRMDELLSIKTSDRSLNRLISNIRWSMKDNFLDTATDCPQRDERMGWTGDAAIFSDSACFLMDTYAFYKKYLYDLHAEQKELGGSVPYVVPMSRYPYHGASVWGDAATIIPWNVYLHYGDRQILMDQYESMKAWVEYVGRQIKEAGGSILWNCGPQFGDWLALDGNTVYGATDRYFIASVFYYNSVLILAKSAAVLGMKAEAACYGKLAGSIRDAILSEYYTTEGRLSISTQTAFSLAIVFDLIPPSASDRVYSDFQALMLADGVSLKTGFVGTRYLCQALLKTGRTDLADRLLFNHAYPGWLYEVDLGATTIWERWNSVLPDGKISPTSMNSLNHYAYGSILSFVMESIAGLRVSESMPGFRTMVIAPNPSKELASLAVSLNTPYGKVDIAWKKRAKEFRLSLTVPFDTTVKLILPFVSEPPQTLSGFPWKLENGSVSVILDKGEYEFCYEIPARYLTKRISLEMAPEELLSYPGARKILYKYFPSFKVRIPWVKEQATMSGVLHSPFVVTNEKTITAVKNEIEALNSF